MGLIFKIITNLHVVTVAAKAVARVGKVLLHSNFGLLGLDRVLSWFGIN
jgi:hypothetical protein